MSSSQQSAKLFFSQFAGEKNRLRKVKKVTQGHRASIRARAEI